MWLLNSLPLYTIFDNCTHIFVSLLNAWKVTLEGIECHEAALARSRLLTSFQEGPHQKLVFQEKQQQILRAIGKLGYSGYFINQCYHLAEGTSIFVGPNESDQKFIEKKNNNRKGIPDQQASRKSLWM